MRVLRIAITTIEFSLALLEPHLITYTYEVGRHSLTIDPEIIGVVSLSLPVLLNIASDY